MMLIPHLHFYGDCDAAITLYEKAFNTKAEEIVRSQGHCDKCSNDNHIAHASMMIHGQVVYLNDRFEFANKEKLPCNASHLIVHFQSVEELQSCYKYFENTSKIIDPFIETPYSKLCGNFIDKFGILWGFMLYTS